MALSKENTNGLDLLWESQAMFAEILASFRECHELLVGSKLFSEGAILQMDECAIDFRQMVLDTVVVAKQVSEKFLTMAMTFFENFIKVDDPKPKLILLGKQAKELGRCFNVIAAWIRDMAGRFRDAQTTTIGQEKRFLQKFQDALDRAKSVEQQLEKEYEREKRKREEIQRVVQRKSIALAWIPIAGILAGSEMREAVERAANLEMVANMRLHEAMKELDMRTVENEKAKYIAEKAGELVTVLLKLEEVCNATATYWTIEGHVFNTHGASMKTDQATMIEVLKDEVVQQNLKFWSESKERMEKYATAMSVIGTSFNFVTRAKGPEKNPVQFTELDLTLNIPSTVDIKKIMAQ
jgi:hypothetical protein